MHKLKTSLFTSLPWEIFQIILSFGVDCELKNPANRISEIRMVANFQSLNKKLLDMKEMQDYFNSFWWKVFENNFGIGFTTELEKLRLQLTKQDEMKRKILLAIYIKSKLYKRPKQDSSQEINIVLLGEGGVGKSSIIVMFIQNVFNIDYDPTIEDTYRKNFNVDDERFLLETLDTAGCEEHSEFRDQFLRHSHAFIIVCALNEESSVKNMRRHVETILRCKQDGCYQIPVVFVMNKMDLLDNIDRNEAIDSFRKEVNSISLDYSLLNYCMIECSAKNRENIDAIFEETVRRQQFDNLTLLKGCIEGDKSYFEECKKRIQSKKKCSIM